MDDLISRQAAIDVADYTDYAGLAIEDVKKVTDEVVKGLKQLQSVQQWKQWIPCSDLIFEVKVIPCKKCKWHGYLTCSNPEGLKGWVTDNDFCSYGEEGEFVRKRR